MMDKPHNIATAIFGAGLAFSVPTTAAANDLRDGGKLLLTNGISSIEGSAGGGLTPWAVIAGNDTRSGIGAQAALTVDAMKDYDFQVASVAIGVFDRVELSYAHQRFDTNKIGGALGLGDNYKFDQDIYGLKVRLAGDLVFGPEFMPAIAMGVQYKKNLNAPVVRAVGARHDEGIDYYLTASKLLLRHSLLVSTTVRATKANQLGLLGFGGDKNDKYSIQVEASLAYQFSRRFAVGAEYRGKPDKLSIAREDADYDIFAAYAVNRHITATIAYTDLGSVATVSGQHGVLFQLQGSF